MTVTLTGDGGDEAFGGYRRYRAGKVAGWLRRVPGARRLVGAGRHLIPVGVDRTTNLGRTRRVLDATTGGRVGFIAAAVHALLFYVFVASAGTLWVLDVVFGLLRSDRRMGRDLLTNVVLVRD